jgi:PPE family
MKVDPSGIADAARRITAALAQLPTADPVHPALAGDLTSQGAAARLTSGGATLAALIGELASGLAATADVLAGVAIGFDGIEAASTANLSTLSNAASAAPVTGFAPPPVHAPDVRPALPPPVPTAGEAISRATHSGDPGRGDAFISGWSAVADAVDDADRVLTAVADNLPATWSSRVSTPAVRTHLLNYRTALNDSGARARGLARQAGQHAADLIQARRDIPAPEEFDQLNEQLRLTWEANRASGGKYAPALAALNARKVDLSQRAAAGYGTYQLVTDATTAPDSGDPVGATDVPVTDAAGQATPQSAGQLATIMSTMLPAALGAVGGLAGGAVSLLTKAPEALAQAATQAAQAAVQQMSGLGGNGDGPGAVAGADPAATDAPLDAAGPGGGETAPAAGGPDSPTPSVLPSTGPAPTAPTLPAGALPDPVRGSAGPGGVMPMGMPMGAMTPGAGSGAAQQRAQRAKHLVVPRTPHTEAVTGKVSEDRIARSASAPGPPEPPGDDPPPASGPQPVVRRITMAPPQDDSS